MKTLAGMPLLDRKTAAIVHPFWVRR